MTSSLISEIDPLTIDDLAALAVVETTPCVSIYMPTHRSGPETTQGPRRLRNLLDRAAELGAGPEVLAPMRDLVEDADFWQHQADGLALLSAPGVFQRHRLPVEVDEEVHVADTFRVRPLVPLASGHDEFRILAVSQKSVRLFRAGRYHVEELDLDGVPRSLAEALAYEDPERQLHARSAGGDGMSFHGHGGGEEERKAEVERFFRALDHGLRERLGVTGVPLVLASVGYYHPIFAAVSTAHTRVLDEVVEGNPERSSAEELHAEAWKIVSRHVGSNGDAAWTRFQDAAGSGLTATDLATVALSAATGRVDTLFVAPGPPVLGSMDVETSTVRIAGEPGAPGSELRTDLVDRAVLDTLGHGGHVHAVEEGALPDGAYAAALLRY